MVENVKSALTSHFPESTLYLAAASSNKEILDFGLHFWYKFDLYSKNAGDGKTYRNTSI